MNLELTPEELTAIALLCGQRVISVHSNEVTDCTNLDKALKSLGEKLNQAKVYGTAYDKETSKPTWLSADYKRSMYGSYDPYYLYKNQDKEQAEKAEKNIKEFNRIFDIVVERNRRMV